MPGRRRGRRAVRDVRGIGFPSRHGGRGRVRGRATETLRLRQSLPIFSGHATCRETISAERPFSLEKAPCGTGPRPSVRRWRRRRKTASATLRRPWAKEPTAGCGGRKTRKTSAFAGGLTRKGSRTTLSADSGRNGGAGRHRPAPPTLERHRGPLSRPSNGASGPRPAHRRRRGGGGWRWEEHDAPG